MSYEYQPATQVKAIDLIAQEALAVVDGAYGTGYPHYHDGQTELAYHNGHHTRSVRRNGERMAEALGLSAIERSVVISAASAHDLVQMKERGVMERESADWFTEKLLAKGIARTRAVAGSLAILATEPRFTMTAEGLLMTQAYNELSYPSKSAQRIALSVAAGDMAEMHSPTGPRVAHDLYLEISELPAQSKPPIDDEFLKFQAAQPYFVSAYSYPDHENVDPVADRLFGGLRGVVADYHQSLADAIVRGDVETWEQVIAADEAFMRDHS